MSDTPYSDASGMRFPDGDNVAEVVDIEISRNLERQRNDLLAALKRLNSYVQSAYGVSPSTISAGAAIAKAKGETE